MNGFAIFWILGAILYLIAAILWYVFDVFNYKSNFCWLYLFITVLFIGVPAFNFAAATMGIGTLVARWADSPKFNAFLHKNPFKKKEK